MDMTGRRYGRLVAIRLEYIRAKNRYWLFKCDCGVEKVIAVTGVRSGRVVSCGCYALERHAEVLRQVATTHGQSKTPEFISWQSAKARCFNKAVKSYPHYGGRGIAMCDLWAKDFMAFREYMGPMPEGHELERIDVNGQYEPGNCRWASCEEQAQNKRVTKLSPEAVREIRGSTETPAALARRFNATHKTITNARDGKSWKNIA
jgi:hypothetical protein